MSQVYSKEIGMYDTNIVSFLNAAIKANCLPENWETLRDNILEILFNNLKKQEYPRSLSERSSATDTLELYCRNYWDYWERITSSSLDNPSKKTWPINEFMDKLVELVDTINEEERTKDTLSFYVKTLSNEVFIYMKAYFYVIMLLCAIIGYNLA